MAFENFNVGEIVKGRVCGVFLIKKFGEDVRYNWEGLANTDFVYLKEVNPEDHSEEGPNPLLAFTEDMIRKL